MRILNDEHQEPESDRIYLACFESKAWLGLNRSSRIISTMVIGALKSEGVHHMQGLGFHHLIAEDRGDGQAHVSLRDFADEIVNVTSFAYVSEQFFRGKLQQKKGQAA